ncbi:MAG: transglutaminase domain-containing protein [Myxococcota bacterium]
MPRFVPRSLVLVVLLVGGLGLTSTAASARIFAFEYAVTVPPMPGEAGDVELFIPLPVADVRQRILSEEIEASVPGVIETEAAYGNRFYHVSAPASDAPLQVTLRVTVDRSVSKARAAIADEELARYLGENTRVKIGHPVLAPMLEEVRAVAGPGASPAKARAIYDWVVDNIEYKKVGSGWGNGDTFWACNERYGNCTDFHAMFTSLARTEGIPARFEIGFPVPEDRSAGQIGGYHCWVEFHLPETGWFPIDASEAFKHPEKRELFYGTHPADRIHFSTGRDLRLGPDHKGPALNYFVYPYVEVGGKPWKGEVERTFRYEDVTPATS